MSEIRRNREKGALALYMGKTDQEAIEAAGLVYSPANARRFRNSRDVRARLRELFEADRKFYEADARRAMREREIIAYSNLMDYCEVVEGAIVLRDAAKVPAELWRAVSSIKQTKNGIEIKLWDKNVALAAIQARVDPVPVHTAGEDDQEVDRVPADQVARWDDPPQANARPN